MVGKENVSASGKTGSRRISTRAGFLGRVAFHYLPLMEDYRQKGMKISSEERRRNNKYRRLTVYLFAKTPRSNCISRCKKRNGRGKGHARGNLCEIFNLYNASDKFIIRDGLKFRMEPIEFGL